MRFLCLVLLDAEIAARMTEADWRAIDKESRRYDKILVDMGKYVASEALAGVGTARTVRVRMGEAVATDGPYMETKEQLAGFILVDARDFEEAVVLAKNIPLARIGAVEVRPVMEMKAS